MISQPNK